MVAADHTREIKGVRHDQGALNAVLSRDRRGIATSEVQVVIPPEPEPYHQRDFKGCVLLTSSNFGEGSGRTADGVAYYGTSAVYTGYTQSVLLHAGFGGNAPLVHAPWPAAVGLYQGQRRRRTMCAPSHGYAPGSPPLGDRYLVLTRMTRITRIDS